MLRLAEDPEKKPPGSSAFVQVRDPNGDVSGAHGAARARAEAETPGLEKQYYVAPR